MPRKRKTYSAYDRARARIRAATRRHAPPGPTRAERPWTPEALREDEWDILQQIDSRNLDTATIAVLRTLGPRGVSALVARGSGKRPRGLSRAERASGTRGETKNVRNPLKGATTRHPGPAQRKRARSAVWAQMQEQEQNVRAQGYPHPREARRAGLRRFLRAVCL